MFDPELESFKTSMDLRAYAAHQGYVLDGKESWRGSAVMRHAGSDKVIIKRDLDGLYVYFSVRDEADRGTTIDFAQKRLRVNFGALRKELRPWVGRPVEALPCPSIPLLQLHQRESPSCHLLSCVVFVFFSKCGGWETSIQRSRE
jgi:hypothetical protein